MRILEAKAVHATLKKRIKSIYHPFFSLQRGFCGLGSSLKMFST